MNTKPPASVNPVTSVVLTTASGQSYDFGTLTQAVNVATSVKRTCKIDWSQCGQWFCIRFVDGVRV